MEFAQKPHKDGERGLTQLLRSPRRVRHAKHVMSGFPFPRGTGAAERLLRARQRSKRWRHSTEEAKPDISVLTGPTCRRGGRRTRPTVTAGARGRLEVSGRPGSRPAPPLLLLRPRPTYRHHFGPFSCLSGLECPRFPYFPALRGNVRLVRYFLGHDELACAEAGVAVCIHGGSCLLLASFPRTGPAGAPAPFDQALAILDVKVQKRFEAQAFTFLQGEFIFACDLFFFIFIFF